MSRAKALRSKRHQWSETDMETVRMVGRMMEAQPELVTKLKVRMDSRLDLDRFKLKTVREPSYVSDLPHGGNVKGCIYPTIKSAS